MEQLLDYVQTHKTLLECLLQQGSGLAISRFSTILHAHYGKYLRRYAGNGFSAENEYLYEFLYTGILGVLQKWLQNECKDDRNQVASVMWRMIVQSLPHTKNPHSFSSLSWQITWNFFISCAKATKTTALWKNFKIPLLFCTECGIIKTDTARNGTVFIVITCLSDTQTLYRRKLNYVSICKGNAGQG